jgi:hypothetical protein
MKKILLVAFLIALNSTIYGQKNSRAEYIDLDFSGSFPPSGWTIENYNTQWSASGTSNAGGSAPELVFTYTSGTLTTRFISPSFNTTGATSLNFSFKQFVDHYGAGYSVGVATRSNGGAWNTVWTTSPSANIGPENKQITISNSDVGSTNFQICFFLSGNAYQIDFWYIDDISLYNPLTLDLKARSINIDKYVAQGNNNVKATVKNIGTTPVTSFNISYQVNDEEPIQNSVTGVNLALDQSYSYTFTEQWNAVPGDAEVKVWVSNINGLGNDNETSNDLTTKIITVASNSVENLPFFEEFTSSTCAPCASFNSSVFTPFLNNNAGQFAIIKYQMNWPAPGDPYYTAEGGVRRTYYGVSGVPSLFTGGKSTSTSQVAVNAAFNSEKAKPAFFTINATSYIQGTTVNANIEVLPYISASNMKLHAAVIEKVTTGNVGNNGETSFKFVMMKMLPNASGTTVNFTDGVPYNISFSQDLTGTKVEQFDDLMLVVFIQNDATKEVFQSSMINSPLSYNVTFNVKDESSNPIEGATVNVAGQNLITNSTGECIAILPNGNHSYTVDALGYSEVSGSVNVDNGNTSVNVTLSSVATYNVTFSVKNINEESITNALVTYNGSSLSTDENGLVTFISENGIYNYSISATGYMNQNGEITVNDEDTFVFINLLEQTYLVTFQTHYSNNDPVIGATISINGQQITTNQNGIATIDLVNGEYDYLIVFEGYSDITGSFIVHGESLTISVIYPLPRFLVTFKVKANSETPVVDADIVINEETITTDATGEASILLTNGTYSYSVSKENFQSITDNLTVEGDALEVEILLIPTGISGNVLPFASLYPNPTNGNFSINVPSVSGNVAVSIYSVTGSLVMSKLVTQNNGRIDMNISQPKGVYYITLTLEDGKSQTLKLVIK